MRNELTAIFERVVKNTFPWRFSGWDKTGKEDFLYHKDTGGGIRCFIQMVPCHKEDAFTLEFSMSRSKTPPVSLGSDPENEFFRENPAEAYYRIASLMGKKTGEDVRWKIGYSIDDHFNNVYDAYKSGSASEQKILERMASDEEIMELIVSYKEIPPEHLIEEIHHRLSEAYDAIEEYILPFFARKFNLE